MLTNCIKNFVRVIVIFALVIATGCHRVRSVSEDEIPKLPCRVEGACDATIIKYLTAFQKRGIKVVTMGQNYMISLPASAVFDDQSAHMKWSGYGLLNDVAIFLKQFRKIAIHITSYSSQYVSPQRERALTLARSRVVGEYLWSQGVDSRFIFTQGLGSDKPITRMTHGSDKSPNARIEITFRRAVVN